MGGVRASGGRIDHHLGIAMVGRYEHGATFGTNSLLYLAEASVDGFDGLYSRLDLAGVTDHIGIGEINNKNVEGTFLNRLHDSLSDTGSAHLRLQIVGGNLGGRHKSAVFSGKG